MVLDVNVHLSKYAMNVYWVKKKKISITVFVVLMRVIQTASGVFDES